MNQPKRYTVTAALPYANGPLHIGHIAGAYLPADIYVRYLRNRGKDVVFVCGSDEHGAAITLKAMKEGVTPQEIVDKYHLINRDAFQDFGIHFDIYHRTSAPLHHQTAADFFQTLNNKGNFEVQTNEQYFDEKANVFLADRYIQGTCPKCSFDGAYGDQCEKCGSTLNPRDLLNIRSTLSGNKPILKNTSHWFLPMQHHETWLKKWISDGVLDGEQHHNPADWKKSVLGQCLSWLDGGLQPRAMTRDLDWGVKVPLPNAEGKVLYVWLDAPIGYISATKQWAQDNQKDWELYWKDKDTALIHFIGKDNIVFHCIIFPIILKAHGEFILPVNVPANEFLNLEGDKISTSRNHAVWLHEYLLDFPDKKDELRYVLCSIAPENKDSEFTWKDFQARMNNELVAILGNFVNRALTLADKYFEGKCIVDRERTKRKQHRRICNLNNKTIYDLEQSVRENIEKFRFRDALSDIMDIARIGNIYLQNTAPWQHTENMDYVKKVISDSIQLCAFLSFVIEPFLPHTSSKMKRLLNIDDSIRFQASIHILHARNHYSKTIVVIFEN
jgi:methionyl-tRNA synthetase